MPETNVDVIRRLFESYSRGDYAGRRTAMLPMSSIRWAREMPALGRDSVQEMWERWDAAWEEMETVPEEFIGAGDNVVVTVHYSARGRGSGIEYDERLFDVYTLRDGRCVRKLEFRRRSEALEAAGIEE